MAQVCQVDTQRRRTFVVESQDQWQSTRRGWRKTRIVEAQPGRQLLDRRWPGGASGSAQATEELSRSVRASSRIEVERGGRFVWQKRDLELAGWRARGEAAARRDALGQLLQASDDADVVPRIALPQRDACLGRVGDRARQRPHGARGDDEVHPRCRSVAHERRQVGHHALAAARQVLFFFERLLEGGVVVEQHHDERKLSQAPAPPLLAQVGHAGLPTLNQLLLQHADQASNAHRVARKEHARGAAVRQAGQRRERASIEVQAVQVQVAGRVRHAEGSSQRAQQRALA